MGEIDPDTGVGTEGLQYDVLALALLGFFFGEFAGVHEPLHERLILGELGGLPVTHEVGA